MHKSKSNNLAEAFELLTSLPDNFFAQGREDQRPQERSDSDPETNKEKP